MNKGLALITTLCLILGFQNCQSTMQPEGMSSSNEVSVTLPAVASGGGSSSGSTVGKVTYVEVPNISDSTSASQKTADLTPYRLVISVQTGTIQLMDDSNAVMETRCLDSGSLQELKTILSGASVCAAQASGDICAMRYTPGYASLYVNESRVNLGEQKDSCGTGRLDLCGGLNDVFQSYVTHVKQNWTQMNCQ